jgi:hypothetical protein
MRTPQTGTSYSAVNYADGKRKKVAWFVSNCDGRNGRNEYATELGRFVRETTLEGFTSFTDSTGVIYSIQNSNSEVYMLFNVIN